MSIVVAVTKSNRTYMAADSLTTFGESQQIAADNSATPKLRRIGGALVGSTGWGVYDRILDHYLTDQPRPDLRGDRAIFSFFLDLWRALHERYPFVNDQSQGRDSPFGDLDTSFLIATASGIYKVSHDLDICRFNQYYAIGSGAEYALGALHVLYETEADADAVAERAVDTACRFDLHCGGEIAVVPLDPSW